MGSEDAKGGAGGGIVSGLVGGGVFLLFWMVLDIPLAWSAAAGAASLAASIAVARGARKAEGPAVGSFVDKALARKTVARARQLASSLRSSCSAMEPGSFRDKFSGLAVGLDSIARDVSDDPKDALAASIFLSNNGEASQRMAELYLRLRKRSPSPADQGSTLAKLDSLLDRMAQASERQLQRLQADEWEELQTEIDLMAETISMDADLKA